MRVFVAGATGAIGRSLVPLLIEAGHTVVGMTRSQARASALRARGAEAVVCDALDAGAVRAAVIGAHPEAVIHQLTDIPATLQPRGYARQLAATNRLRREGTAHLIAAAHEAGASRILAQSVAFAYAPHGEWVKDEAAPLALDSPPPMDAVFAAVAELERQVLGASGTVLRYGFFYGPGTHFAADGFYARMVRIRLVPLVGSGNGMWSFIHVADAAAATVAALQRDARGTYNIVDDDPAAVREWLPAYASAIGAKPPLRVPVWLGRLAGGGVTVMGMTEQRGASNAKAKRELGWTPAHASWRDGFRTAAG